MRVGTHARTHVLLRTRAHSSPTCHACAGTRTHDNLRNLHHLFGIFGITTESLNNLRNPSKPSRFSILYPHSVIFGRQEGGWRRGLKGDIRLSILQQKISPPPAHISGPYIFPIFGVKFSVKFMFVISHMLKITYKILTIITIVPP